MSEQTTPAAAAPPPQDERGRIEEAAAAAAEPRTASPVARFLLSPAGRNVGLVLALLLLVLVGVVTAGERFASIDNTLTILRYASVIGVVSIG
ncbi:MAG TPA: ABC transporter permease, partial [Ornithinibacter sp.]|nr:ABC transporter permease [Ornithinibacter sp.]